MNVFEIYIQILSICQILWNFFEYKYKSILPYVWLKLYLIIEGVAATCVLRSAFNSSFDEALIQHFNHTFSNFKLLMKYFEPECESVFRHDIPLDNFVPPIPTPQTPTLDPVLNDSFFMSSK